MFVDMGEELRFLFEDLDFEVLIGGFEKECGKFNISGQYRVFIEYEVRFFFYF